MYPHRRVPEGQGEHVFWRSNTVDIPDDVIDPQLLAESNQSDAADQPSLPQQAPQLLVETSQSDAVEQTSVYQHPPLDVHQYNPQVELQPNRHVSLPPGDGSISQQQQLGLHHPNAFSNPHVNPQVISRFNSQSNPEYSPQDHSPSRDGSIHHQQPFNPSSLAYSPPQDGRVFFQQAASSPSLPRHSNRMSQGDVRAFPSARTPHCQQDRIVRANVQSPAKSKSRAFSRGFGQGPMSEADEGPFRFQDEPDSSPLTSLTATPARPSRPDNSDMEMDLNDWESGREAEVGIPSSSPPQNNVTPKRVGQGQEEDLQGREGQYQRPRRYNIGLLLESVTIPSVADMEIEEGVDEATSHADVESASYDPSLQRRESQESARPRAASLDIVTPPRGSILRRFAPGTGLSFPSGVPYSTRYSDYIPPPEDFWRPIFAARPVLPGRDLAVERGRSLSADGRTRTDNVSGPQDGESSRHGQHLNSQTEGVRHHTRAAIPGPSATASTAPHNPQPTTSRHGPASLPQDALQETSVNEVVEVTDPILTHRRGPHRHHLRPLAPNPPIEDKGDTSPQPPHRDITCTQQHTQSNDQTQQPRFTNMAQFQPLLALPPPIQHPLLLSPFPPRIPGTLTPALLSLAMNPPRSLQLGTTDSLQPHLRACGMPVLYNDMYPRALPISVRREPFNRTVFVEARYLSVIGLLYPRAEFIVSRIAEGVGNQKVEPNSGVMMDKWHVYKAVRMSGEEMQKLGVCVWSEKVCGEWEPVVEEPEGREVKRVKRMEVVDEDEDEEEEEEESDNAVVVSGRAKGSEKEGKENVRMTVEEELDEECEDMEIIDAGEVQTSKTTNRKERAKEVQVADKKDKGKEILQENNDSGNAAAPPAPTGSSASAFPRRSTRVQSRQASVEETASTKSENTTTAPSNLSGKTIITRKLRAIQLDETGATITPNPNPARPTKTPKPRLSTAATTATTTTTKPPITPSHRTSSTPYMITLHQRDYPLGGVARIQCTPQARQVIESIQNAFGVQHPYEVWRHKDYTVHDPDTGEITQRYIKVLRGYAGDENTDDGLMRLFLDEMDQRIKDKAKKKNEKGKVKDGEEEEGKDMAALEERVAWKERYLALKRRGKRAVARAKGRRREGEDMDLDYDEWLEERHEQEGELIEKWFAEREGLVEEEELARKTVEFALFEYGGGDGLALGKP
ncbi:uncharacterized protein B0T23DRAFT_316163 [Neurospora hispaniola]|uniref:Uncharacterized protein n=1 Tax=Neurospora hispaniola TaxID=588809 RepID=A0AAJ0I797_9PEZI|nr:hypothetical protein B0T23DRAFT_316163 [Neurospora hispaniola]